MTEKQRPWNYKDITHKRFGKLVALREDKENISRNTYWICQCDCGNIKSVALMCLTSGKTKSCGCLRYNKGKERTRRTLNTDKFKLSQKQLKEQVYYNPRSGIFRWRNIKGGRKKKWIIAGSFCKYSNYHTIRINGFLYKAHVIAWLYMRGYFPKEKIDHIDRDRQNNKWNNLRLVNDICHARNMGIKKGSKTGIKGVRKHRRVWIAYITVAYKNIVLKRCKSFDDAVLARWEGEKQYGFENCYTNSSAFLYLYDKGLINNIKR